MRLGVLGGTFDPIHMGHLIIAEEVRTHLGLEQVLFLPTGLPWLKEGQPISPAQHRLEMTRLAVADNPAFAVSSIEIERPGPSYTVETLMQLQQERGSCVEPYFIVGMDSVLELHRWREPGRLLEMCTLVAVDRPGSDGATPEALDELLPGASGRIVHIPGPHIGISGTEIRRRVAQNQTIRYWVPGPVEEYIAKSNLYRGERTA